MTIIADTSLTREEWAAQRDDLIKQENEAVAALMPLVQAAAPAWARPVAAYDLSDEPTDVCFYSADHLTAAGTAFMFQVATIDEESGRVTLEGRAEPHIYVEEKTAWTPEKIRTLAAELSIFADLVEALETMEAR